MIDIYRKAAICRAFEEEVFRQSKAGNIRIPIYLSSGQEYIPATLAHLLSHRKPAIFPQHRNHSQYLCFGGSMAHLIRELTGGDTGMQGSASIADGDIFGHDGMMGSNVPIGVGYCDATRRQTIIFFGDAAAEEDYVIAAIGYAATKSLPVLFVVEDNNLAILTEKKVRRTWSIAAVADAMGLDAYDITDRPDAIAQAIEGAFEHPRLLNVHTTRLYWHAGAGQDPHMGLDRHKEVAGRIGRDDIDEEAAEQVRGAWELYAKR